MEAVDGNAGGQEVQGHGGEEIQVEQESESYRNVVRCLLLPEIIGYLPWEEQLSARTVSSDFDDEANVALRRKLGKGKIQINTNPRMLMFLADFQHGPMKLLSSMTIEMTPALVEQRLLTSFCQQHGEEIGSLKMSIPAPSALWMLVKAHKILEATPNLKVLDLETCRIDFVQFNPVVELAMGVTPLPQFVRLHELKFSGPSSQVQMLLEIFNASPNLRKVTRFKMHEVPGLSPTSTQLILRLQNYPLLNIQLRMLMFPPNNPGDDILVRILSLSNLSARHVNLFLVGASDDNDHQRNLQRDRGRLNLQQWLIRMSSSHWPMQTLQLRCSTLRTGHVTFPVMKELLTLDLGLNVDDEQHWDMFGAIIPTTPVHNWQIPKVSKVVMSNIGDILNENEAFPAVTSLHIQDWNVGSNTRGPYSFPNSERWSNQFQNLTSLVTFVVSGHEDDLTPVLRDLLHLQHLQLTFESYFRAQHHTIWEVLTAIPVSMDVQTALTSLLPGPVLDAPDLSPAASSFRKLRHLKTMKFLKAMPVAFLAIAHLTSLGFLPVYEHVEFKFLRQYKYIPDPNITAALQSSHRVVQF